MKTDEERKFGWIKDSTKNENDYHKFKLVKNIDTITKIDLRPKCPPVLDQGKLGSCTAFAGSTIFQFAEMKQGVNDPIIPSTLFIYYNTRALEGKVNVDSGAELFNVIFTLKTTGTCSETLWPYIPTAFDIKPPDECYVQSLKHKCILSKKIIQTLPQMKQCLIEGFPFIIGFYVYESFQSSRAKESGIISMPNIRTEELLGGHAVVVVGFNDKKQIFIVQNSWGRKWGDAGYCYIPYAYLTDPKLADDLWAILSVT